MQFFFVVTLLGLGNIAQGWHYDGITEDYYNRYNGYERVTESSADDPDKCPLTEQAKFLESIVRVNLFLVKSTPNYLLRSFVLNKSEELSTAVNSALRFVQLVAEDVGPKPESEPDKPSLLQPSWMAQRRKHPKHAMFSVVDLLSKLNETHTTTILKQAHLDLRGVVTKLWYTNPRSVKEDIVVFLRKALVDCRKIMITGCEGVETTEYSTWYLRSYRTTPGYYWGH